MIWDKILLLVGSMDSESIVTVKKQMEKYAAEVILLSSVKEIVREIDSRKKIFVIPLISIADDKKLNDLLCKSSIETLLPHADFINYFNKKYVDKLGKIMNLNIATTSESMDTSSEEIKIFYFKKTPGELNRHVERQIDDRFLSKIDQIAISAGRCTIITIRKTSKELLLESINYQPNLTCESDFFHAFQGLYLDDYLPHRYNKFLRDLVIYKMEEHR